MIEWKPNGSSFFNAIWFLFLPEFSIATKDCPHAKEARGKKNATQLAFSLVQDSNDAEPLNFVAPDQQTYDYWIDGLNALLGQTIPSLCASLC